MGEALRGLIDKIVLTPAPGGSGLAIDLHGAGSVAAVGDGCYGAWGGRGRIKEPNAPREMSFKVLI